jgi:hypothetical protein
VSLVHWLSVSSAARFFFLSGKGVYSRHLGEGDAVVNTSISSGPFHGAFSYCDGLPPRGWYSGMERSCPVPPVYCEASNHRFTLTRR